MTRPRLVLLGRPGCHLCDDFHEALEAQFAGRVTVEQANVDDRPGWRRLYGTRIPVLLDGDGNLVCEGVLDPAAILRRL